MATDVERLIDLTETALRQTEKSIASANRALSMVESYRVERAELEGQRDALIQALRGAVDLIESWANGQVFENSGIRWPEGGCNAPALLNARAVLSKVSA